MVLYHVGLASSTFATATVGEHWIRKRNWTDSASSAVISGGSVLAADLVTQSVPTLKNMIGLSGVTYSDEILSALISTLVKQTMGGGLFDKKSFIRLLYELGYVLSGSFVEPQLSKVLPSALSGTKSM